MYSMVFVEEKLWYIVLLGDDIWIWKRIHIEMDWWYINKNTANTKKKKVVEEKLSLAAAVTVIHEDKQIIYINKMKNTQNIIDRDWIWNVNE